jgi:hypothetical protein
MSDGGETLRDARDDRAAPIDNGMDRWPVVDPRLLPFWKPLPVEILKVIYRLRVRRER